jgi:hypothetical protein
MEEGVRKAGERRAWKRVWRRVWRKTNEGSGSVVTASAET